MGVALNSCFITSPAACEGHNDIHICVFVYFHVWTSEIRLKGLLSEFLPSLILCILININIFTCFIYIHIYIYSPYLSLSLSSLVQWGSTTHVRNPVTLSLSPWASQLSHPWPPSLRPRWSPPSPRPWTPTPPPPLLLSAWTRSISPRTGPRRPGRAPAEAASPGEELTWAETPPTGNNFSFHFCVFSSKELQSKSSTVQ